MGGGRRAKKTTAGGGHRSCQRNPSFFSLEMNQYSSKWLSFFLPPPFRVCLRSKEVRGTRHGGGLDARIRSPSPTKQKERKRERAPEEPTTANEMPTHGSASVGTRLFSHQTQFCHFPGYHLLVNRTLPALATESWLFDALVVTTLICP